MRDVYHTGLLCALGMEKAEGTAGGRHVGVKYPGVCGNGKLFGIRAAQL